MKKLRILLASGSPRRMELLKALDYEVRQISIDYNEKLDPDIKPEAIPEVLAAQKMEIALPFRENEDAVLTADTVVIWNKEVLHKPVDDTQAREYLRCLSQSEHQVITGVSITTDQTVQLSVTTRVWMDRIEDEDIDYYIQKYRPLDKAGAYGIQEWIGWSHIRKIEGSYANVMGLPTFEVYQYLENKV